MVVLKTVAELFLQVQQYLGWQWNAKRYVDITGMFKIWHSLDLYFLIWRKAS